MIEFPTIVYKTPGNHQRHGGTYDYRAASDYEELAALLSNGWFATLPEAIAGRAAEPLPDDNAPPSREELEAKAVELDIKFDGRTTDKSLGEKIENALLTRVGG